MIAFTPYRPVRRDRPPPEVPRPVCTCEGGLLCHACRRWGHNAKMPGHDNATLTAQIRNAQHRLKQEQQLLTNMAALPASPATTQTKKRQRERIRRLQLGLEALQAKQKMLRAQE